MKDLTDLGYNKEEEYFYKLNKDLIDKRRSKLDEGRAVSEDSKGDFWMVCPKCGGSMEEIDVLGVKVDKCTSCHGTYFDKGELETLFAAKENQSFITFLKGFFK